MNNFRPSLFRFAAAIVGCFYLLVSPWALGQSPPIKKNLIQDLVRTFGFCQGQQVTLGQIREMYPDLEAEVILTEAQWKSAFQQGEKGVEERLKAFAPDRWDETQKKLMAQFLPILKEQNSKATHETAVSYLEAVKERSKGAIDSPCLEMLLASHPQFIKSPEQEFTAGYTGTFTTKDHLKNKGVNLTIKYPLSWKKQEGERPNIVQKWTSDGGHGNDTFMISIREIPGNMTPEESAEFYSEVFAKAIIINGELLKYTTGKLEGQPVGMVRFKQTVQRLDVSLEVYALLFYMEHKGRLITLQLSSYAPTEEKQEARIQQLEPLIRLMMNSVIMPDNFK